MNNTGVFMKECLVNDIIVMASIPARTPFMQRDAKGNKSTMNPLIIYGWHNALMHHTLSRQDAIMQPWWVTRQCCNKASCQPYWVETLLKDWQNARMQHQ